MIPAVVAILSLPAAEMVFRLLGARPVEDLAGLYCSFGERGYRLRENVITSTEWYSGPFTVRTDDLGLRCGAAAETRTRTGDAVDFLVLGDSQGFGQCLDYEASLAGGWACLARSRGVHVANCSVGGQYLKNQLEIARWLHANRGVTFANVTILLTPYLIAAAAKYNHTNVGADGKLYDREPTSMARLSVWAKTHMAVFGRIRNAFRKVRGVDQDNRFLHFFDTGASYQARLGELRNTLGEIEQWASANGAALQIIYTPLAVESNFADAAALAAEAGQVVDSGVPGRMANTVAQELGLPLLDLRTVLASRRAAGGSISCRGDPHYNQETSLACAQFIWKALSKARAEQADTTRGDETWTRPQSPATLRASSARNSR